MDNKLIWNIFHQLPAKISMKYTVLGDARPQNSIFHTNFRDLSKLAIQTLFIHTSSNFAYLPILKCSLQWLGLFLNFVSF